MLCLLLMPMQRRLIFPLVMFALAALSFGYGTWQWLTARAVLASADARIAHTLQTVEDQASWSDRQKQAFYLALFKEYPPAPTLFGIDLSGSFASEQQDDRCVNDGQRAVCRSLAASGTAPETMSAICGTCNPLSP